MDEDTTGLYLSVEQAATRLGKGQRQIYNYIRQEKLRGVKSNQGMFIPSEDVERLAAELAPQLPHASVSTDLAIANSQLTQARMELATISEQIGQLREQRDARPSPEELQRWRDRTIAAEARAKALEEQIAYIKQQQALPFWRRWRR